MKLFFFIFAHAHQAKIWTYRKSSISIYPFLPMKRSVSLCREIDAVFGAVRTCFDNVLSKFSAFQWERILILQSACVNMVMPIQVHIITNK